MRFYSFTNANYMSQLQLGLQTAHVVAEVAVNSYKFKNSGMFGMWARDHKTITILNGGNCAGLLEIKEFFEQSANPYVWASFNEDQESLNGAITAVGIVVPAEIYETAKLVRSRVIYQPRGSEPTANFIFDSTGGADTDLEIGKLCRFYNEADQWTQDLIGLINSCRLA